MFGRLFTIIAAFAAACCAVSCAKEETHESAANKAYVMAAGEVAKASQAFDSGDYIKSLAICKKAKSDVEKIIELYPDSTVAFKIITEPKLRIGVCEYGALADTILILEKICMSDFANVKYAWAMSVANNSDGDFLFALLNMEPQNSGAFTRENILKMAETLAKNSRVDRAAYVKAIADYSENSTKKVAEQDVKDSQKNVVEKISDEAEFLKNANKEASLVVFDINSIDKLRKMCPIAKNAGGKIAKEFGDILSQAGANIGRISVPSLKIAAAEKLAFAFADYGEETKAIAIASELPDGENKTNFLVGIVGDISRNGKFADALEIVKILKSDSAKYRAYGAIMKAAVSAKNEETVAKIASIVNVNIPAFSDFIGVFGDKANDANELLMNRIYAETLVASIFASKNPIAAANIVREALANLKGFAEKYDNKAFVARASIGISNVYLTLGQNKEAYEASILGMEKGNLGIACANLCRLGIEFKKRGENALSKNAFENSAKGANSITLALAVHYSGIEDSMAFDILQSHLPRFSDIALDRFRK